MCNILGAFFNSVFHVLVISYIYQHSHSTFSKKKKKNSHSMRVSHGCKPYTL